MPASSLHNPCRYSSSSSLITLSPGAARATLWLPPPTPVLCPSSLARSLHVRPHEPTTWADVGQNTSKFYMCSMRRRYVACPIVREHIPEPIGRRQLSHSCCSRAALPFARRNSPALWRLDWARSRWCWIDDETPASGGVLWKNCTNGRADYRTDGGGYYQNQLQYTGECVGNMRKVVFSHACACKAQTYRMVAIGRFCRHGHSTPLGITGIRLPLFEQRTCFPAKLPALCHMSSTICSCSAILTTHGQRRSGKFHCPRATSHSMRTWEVGQGR